MGFDDSVRRYVQREDIDPGQLERDMAEQRRRANLTRRIIRNRKFQLVVGGLLAVAAVATGLRMDSPYDPVMGRRLFMQSRLGEEIIAQVVQIQDRVNDGSGTPMEELLVESGIVHAVPRLVGAPWQIEYLGNNAVDVLREPDYDSNQRASELFVLSREIRPVDWIDEAISIVETMDEAGQRLYTTIIPVDSIDHVEFLDPEIFGAGISSAPTYLYVHPDGEGRRLGILPPSLTAGVDVEKSNVLTMGHHPDLSHANGVPVRFTVGHTSVYEGFGWLKLNPEGYPYPNADIQAARGDLFYSSPLPNSWAEAATAAVEFTHGVATVRSQPNVEVRAGGKSPVFMLFDRAKRHISVLSPDDWLAMQEDQFAAIQDGVIVQIANAVTINPELTTQIASYVSGYGDASAESAVQRGIMDITPEFDDLYIKLVLLVETNQGRQWWIEQTRDRGEFAHLPVEFRIMAMLQSLRFQVDLQEGEHISHINVVNIGQKGSTVQTILGQIP